MSAPAWIDGIRNGDRNNQIRLTLGWLTVALTLVGFYMSYGALLSVARGAGLPDERAVVFPVIIDAVAAGALLIAMFVVRHTWFSQALPWVIFGLYSLATIAGNAESVALIPDEDLKLDRWVAQLVHAAPSISAMITAHLSVITLIRPAQSKTRKKKPVPTTETATVPTGTQNRTKAETPRVSPTERDAARDEVLALAAAGHTPREIILETGVPKSTVHRWLAPTRDEASA